MAEFCEYLECIFMGVMTGVIAFGIFILVLLAVASAAYFAAGAMEWIKNRMTERERIGED